MRNHYLRKIVKSAQKECVKVFCAEKNSISAAFPAAKMLFLLPLLFLFLHKLLFKFFFRIGIYIAEKIIFKLI